MENMVETLKSVLTYYAGPSGTSNLYEIYDDEHHTYAIAAVNRPPHPRNPRLICFIRIEDDRYIIEHDNDDKPVSDFLASKGIPDDKIIRAHRHAV